MLTIVLLYIVNFNATQLEAYSYTNCHLELINEFPAA